MKLNHFKPEIQKHLFGIMQVNDVKSKAHPSLIGKPLFTGELSDKQWKMLEQMQREMHAEYLMRRQMLIKRLDVTVQSFQVGTLTLFSESTLSFPVMITLRSF